MYRLSSIILFLFGCTQIYAQSSPHGKSLKIDCAKCHTSDSWQINIKTLKFNHNTTSFKLEGAHAQTNCTDCHKTLVFNEAKNECMSCHTDMHSGSVGNDCARCHTPKSWVVDNIYELHDENGFPLTGSHSNVDCIGCHKSETELRFDRIGNECINCHQTDFDNTKNPNHVAAGFSTDCATCHNTNQSWTPATFDHTNFPLTLGHNIQDCTQCHTGGNFTNTSTDCVSCHQTNYDNTSNPNHVAAGFSTDCASCHTTNPGWTPSTFDHSTFPLTLGHNIQDCNQCHTSGNYTNTSSDCVSCHQTNFNNTTNPNHIAAGFPTDCASCHTTNPGWTPSTFDHTNFPLTLGHNIQDCTQCHIGGNFTNTSPDCVSCHQTNYNNTSNPNHVAAGFSTDCVSCHTTNPGWTPSTFDHSKFPLTLGHNIQDCTQCHTSGKYADTSPDCVSCHQTNYNNTTNPNHVAAGFPTDCVACHTTNPGWTPATFDHTNFPLTLGHNITDCTQCHIGGNYTNTSPDCVSCHQANYNNTTNPNHAAAGFPTDCASCHTTNPGWTPSTFDHDGMYFPIYSGKHQGVWNTCAGCHTVANNFASFTCIACHEHSNKAQVDNKHIGVSAYSYTPTSCFDCHPNGNKNGNGGGD